MTAEIIQFVPRPNPDRERKLAEEAAKILNPFVETAGYTESGIDGLWKDTDPA